MVVHGLRPTGLARLVEVHLVKTTTFATRMRPKILHTSHEYVLPVAKIDRKAACFGAPAHP